MKVFDPVCGMQIEDDKAAGKADYKGKTYFFCSDSCKNKFIKNPASFVDKKPWRGHGFAYLYLRNILIDPARI